MPAWLTATFVSVAVSLAAVWLALALGYLWIRPDGATVKEAVRIPADVVRLVRRLLADGGFPRGARIRLWLLLGYLLMPLDVVPDFIPVIGYADDVIVVAILLGGAVRQVGFDAVEEVWPGSTGGLEVVRRLCRL